MNPVRSSGSSRSLGREAAGGLAVPERNLGAKSPGIAVALPPLTRDPAGAPCVMCDHPRRAHTDATDGAGWCAWAGCECGGFQGKTTSRTGGGEL
jgi:hypothetical protein